MGPRVGLDGCGKSRPHTGIRSPDRSARNESLYLLSYPGSYEPSLPRDIQSLMLVPLFTRNQTELELNMCRVVSERKFRTSDAATF